MALPRAKVLYSTMVVLPITCPDGQDVVQEVQETGSRMDVGGDATLGIGTEAIYALCLTRSFFVESLYTMPLLAKLVNYLGPLK